MIEHTGIISRIESKDVFVFDKESKTEIRCSLRGKFKKDFNLKKDKLYQTDFAVVGDFVNYELNQDHTGVINKILERRNHLSRKAPKIKGASYRGERLEQVVASNIDNFFIITSIYSPEFNNKSVDRFLVTGESSKMNNILVINKTDLDEDKLSSKWLEFYSSIGYKTILTSTYSNEGIDEIRKMLIGKTSLFWGHSGVGKSSLLNSLFSEINLHVGEISQSTNKGKHTTVTVKMLEPSENTFIIDTPGIREIEPYGIKKEDLGHYFIEFSDYINLCRYNTCTHSHEPNCGVINAVIDNKISEVRYESYLRMLETIEDDLHF